MLKLTVKSWAFQPPGWKMLDFPENLPLSTPLSLFCLQWVLSILNWVEFFRDRLKERPGSVVLSIINIKCSQRYALSHITTKSHNLEKITCHSVVCNSYWSQWQQWFKVIKNQILLENKRCYGKKMKEVFYLITDIVSIHPF